MSSSRTRSVESLMREIEKIDEQIAQLQRKKTGLEAEVSARLAQSNQSASAGVLVAGEDAFLDYAAEDDTKKKRRTKQNRQPLRPPPTFTTASDSRLAEFERVDLFPWSGELEEAATRTFGITNFRPFQRAIINAVLSENDVFGILSTGSGKSLCFQLPALLSQNDGKVTLVISPLISLIYDQVLELRSRGVEAVYLTSGLEKDQVRQIMNRLTSLASGAANIGKRRANGTSANGVNQSNISTSSGFHYTPQSSPIRLVYVTPEKIAKSKRFMSILEKLYQAGKLALIVVDECHCCSQYGHDFRPDYKRLGVLKMSFPTVPLLGLTATCPPSLLPELQKMLRVDPLRCIVFTGPLKRDNLSYHVFRKPTSARAVIDFIHEWIRENYLGKKGIIYCFSKREAENVAEKLIEISAGEIKCAVYHADMPDQYKTQTQTRWKAERDEIGGEAVIDVVVATIAFGLGINNPNVRYVIHHSMSKSLEGYYQESGRAGRDGDPAQCVLLYRAQDVFRLSTMVFSEPEGLRQLYAMARYATDETQCRKRTLIEWFGSGEEVFCNRGCDVCLRESEKDNEDDIIIANLRPLAYILCSLLLFTYDKSLNTIGPNRLTVNQLFDAWHLKSPLGQAFQSHLQTSIPALEKAHESLFASVFPPGGKNSTFPLSARVDKERAIVKLLVEGYIEETMHYTAYSTVSYLKCSAKGRMFVRKVRLSKGNLLFQPLAQDAPEGSEDWEMQLTVAKQHAPAPKRKAERSVQSNLSAEVLSDTDLDGLEDSQDDAAIVFTESQNNSSELEIINLEDDSEEDVVEEPVTRAASKAVSGKRTPSRLRTISSESNARKKSRSGNPTPISNSLNNGSTGVAKVGAVYTPASSTVLAGDGDEKASVVDFFVGDL